MQQVTNLLSFETVVTVAPDVFTGLTKIALRIQQQLSAEHHTAIERKLLQHALAETVNGENTGVVHLRQIGIEPVGQLFQCIGIVGNVQLPQPTGQIRVNRFQRGGRGLSISISFIRIAGHRRPQTQHVIGQLPDAFTDTPTQLFRRGIGKGHHQNLVTRQPPGAVPQQQTTVQTGDGVGFSGTRTGFNQRLSVQWEGMDIQ